MSKCEEGWGMQAVTQASMRATLLDVQKRSSLHGESIPWQKILKHTNKKAQIFLIVYLKGLIHVWFYFHFI